LYADGIELHKTNGKPDVYLMDPPNAEYIRVDKQDHRVVSSPGAASIVEAKGSDGTNVHSGDALRWAIAFLSVIPELTLGT
jgi:hypothetical protein